MQWVIKTSGELRQFAGPYDTGDIVDRIQKGLLSPSDLIGEYPGGDFKPASQYDVFFEAFLGVLTGNKSDKQSPPSNTDKTDIDPTIESEDPTEAITLPTHKPPKVDTLTEVSKPEESSAPVILAQKHRNQPEFYREDQIIDLKLNKPKKMKRRKVGVLLAILSLILAAGLYLINSSSNRTSEVPKKITQFSLPEVKFNYETNSANENLAELQQESLKSLRLGDYQNLKKSFLGFKKILEAESRSTQDLVFICLNSLDLWDTIDKGRESRENLAKISLWASRVDPGGASALFCKSVELILFKKYNEAESLLNTSLDSLGTSKDQGLFLALKAYKMFKKKNYVSASSYFESALRFNPEYTNLWLLFSLSLEKSGQSSQGNKALIQAYNLNSRHPNILATKAHFDYQYLQKPKDSEISFKKLQSSLKNNTGDPQILSRAFSTQAEIQLQKGDTSKALLLAKKAYEYQPTNSLAKNIIIQLGDQSMINEKKSLSTQLFEEAEEFKQARDCGSAQAYYKESYKLNSKNAKAALRAAECLWEMSLKIEALKWTEKAIFSNPRLVEAYVLYSKFLVEKFEFEKAAKILSKGKSYNPENYEIDRSLAALELARKNPQSAIQFAERALNKYESDIETLIILYKSYDQLGDLKKSFSYASRARELDSSNVEAQIAYAFGFSKVRGMGGAQQYMMNKSKDTPDEVRYPAALAKLYYLDEKYQECLDISQTWIDREEQVQELYFIHGQCSHKQNLKTQALGSYLTAVMIDPSDPRPLFSAAQIYIQAKNFKEALFQLERVKNISPKFPGLNLNISKIHKAQRKHKKALSAIDEEIKNFPNSGEAYIFKAQIFFDMGLKKQAQLRSLNKKSPSYETSRSEVYSQMISYYKLCGENYQNALSRITSNSNTYIALSKCYRYAGLLDSALAALEKSREIDPGNPEMWKEIGLLFEKKSEFSLAEKALTQYLTLSPNAPDKALVQSKLRSIKSLYNNK